MLGEHQGLATGTPQQRLPPAFPSRQVLLRSSGSKSPWMARRLCPLTLAPGVPAVQVQVWPRSSSGNALSGLRRSFSSSQSKCCDDRGSHGETESRTGDGSRKCGAESGHRVDVLRLTKPGGVCYAVCAMPLPVAARRDQRGLNNSQTSFLLASGQFCTGPRWDPGDLGSGPSSAAVV